MDRLGGIKTYLLTSIALVLLALVALWLDTGGLPFQSARDFEECVEQVEAKAQPKTERAVSLTDCNARFAGRRKPGGGYTYYDFMQDRKFDIGGPNPTAEERKQIDRAHLRPLSDVRAVDTFGFVQEKVHTLAAQGFTGQGQFDRLIIHRDFVARGIDQNG